MKRTFKLVIVNDNRPVDRSVEKVELDNDSIPLENDIITIVAKKDLVNAKFSKYDVDFYFNGQQAHVENLQYRIYVGHQEFEDEDLCSELLTREDLIEIAKVVTSSVTLLPKFDEYLRYLDIIINKIKDTNTLFFGTLFKSLEASAAKFILRELGFPEESNSIFLPKDCNVKIIDNNVNCYYLDFESNGFGENTSASLFNSFIIFYENLYRIGEQQSNEHSIISRWGGKVLIDANRPINDPLRDILHDKRHLVFSNCGFFDSVSGKVFSKISDYPSNNTTTLKEIALNNWCVGFQTRSSSVYFMDTVVDIDMDEYSSISGSRGNSKYVTACQFDCSFIDYDFSSAKTKTDVMVKIRQENPRCEIRLNNFISLFPPFFKIKERLDCLGITNFYYPDKLLQNLWELLKDNPTDFSNKPSDLILSTCTGYIEYLQSRDKDKYNELISIFPRKGGAVKLMYTSYQSFKNSLRKRCYYSSKEDDNVKKLFIYFYNNFKNKIPKEATEFYFGSDNVILENNNKTVLRTINISPEGQKPISIDINPLYGFFKCGLELGIDPNRLISTVIGRDSNTDIIGYPEVGKYKKGTTAESIMNNYVSFLLRTLPKSIEINIE